MKALGSTSSPTQQNELLDKRRRLEARIIAYEQRISVIMKLDDDIQFLSSDGNIIEIDAKSSDEPSESDIEGSFTPESEVIILPSSLAPGQIDRLSLHSIAFIESELRKGQVTDALEGLRLALGEKSLCFRMQVRNANSQRTTHRAWDNVHRLDAEARKWRSFYLLARSALQRLPTDSEYLTTLHDITDDNLKLSGDITQERRFGQRSDILPWFWRIGCGNNMSSPGMEECKCFLYVHVSLF